MFGCSEETNKALDHIDWLIQENRLHEATQRLINMAPTGKPSCRYCARLYRADEVQCEGCGAPRKSRESYRDERPIRMTAEDLDFFKDL